jgi:hypothetical protein
MCFPAETVRELKQGQEEIKQNIKIILERTQAEGESFFLAFTKCILSLPSQSVLFPYYVVLQRNQWPYQMFQPQITRAFSPGANWFFCLQHFQTHTLVQRFQHSSGVMKMNHNKRQGIWLT